MPLIEEPKIVLPVDEPNELDIALQLLSSKAALRREEGRRQTTPSSSSCSECDEDTELQAVKNKQIEKIKKFFVNRHPKPKTCGLDTFDIFFSLIDHSIQRLEPLSEGFKNEANILQNQARSLSF